MPRDGSGNYTQPVSSVSPAVASTTINPTDFNGLTTDISTEITDSLDRSGKGAMLAALAMGGFKVQNVGAPGTGTDAARQQDIPTSFTLSGDVTSSGNVTTLAKVQGTTVTGSTGTGLVVLAAAPTLTGKSQITGITDGTTPAAGYIGEANSATGGPTSVTNNINKTITSITLAAGNWHIIAYASFTGAGGATLTQVSACVSTVTDSFTVVNNARVDCVPRALSNITWVPGEASCNVSINGSTTYYGVVFTAFASGTATATVTLSAIRIS